MKKFIDSPYVKELCEVTANTYRQGWDERNGGNISYLLDEEQIRPYFKKDRIIRYIDMDFEADPIVRNHYFLVTGTGKFFKNVAKDPETNLGLIKVCEDGKRAALLWGYKDGCKMTSEFAAHLMSHAVRLKIDPKNRVVMHNHPTYTIVMGACTPVDEVEFTRRLWKSNTEAVVVFPEGVGVLPCMICGTNAIGEATAEKMKKYRVVSWTNHGVYGVGKTVDEAFSLIETVEKTATLYMKSVDHLVNEIPDEIILGLAKLWHLKIMPGVIKDSEK